MNVFELSKKKNLEIYANFNSAEPMSIHVKMGMKLIKLLLHPSINYK